MHPKRTGRTSYGRTTVVTVHQKRAGYPETQGRWRRIPVPVARGADVAADDVRCRQTRATAPGLPTPGARGRPHRHWGRQCVCTDTIAPAHTATWQTMHVCTHLDPWQTMYDVGEHAASAGGPKPLHRPTMSDAHSSDMAHRFDREGERRHDAPPERASIRDENKPRTRGLFSCAGGFLDVPTARNVHRFPAAAQLHTGHGHPRQRHDGERKRRLQQPLQCPYPNH